MTRRNSRRPLARCRLWASRVAVLLTVTVAALAGVTTAAAAPGAVQQQMFVRWFNLDAAGGANAVRNSTYTLSCPAPLIVDTDYAEYFNEANDRIVLWANRVVDDNGIAITSTKVEDTEHSVTRNVVITNTGATARSVLLRAKVICRRAPSKPVFRPRTVRAQGARQAFHLQSVTKLVSSGGAFKPPATGSTGSTYTVNYLTSAGGAPAPADFVPTQVNQVSLLSCVVDANAGSEIVLFDNARHRLWLRVGTRLNADGTIGWDFVYFDGIGSWLPAGGSEVTPLCGQVDADHGSRLVLARTDVTGGSQTTRFWQTTSDLTFLRSKAAAADRPALAVNPPFTSISSSVPGGQAGLVKPFLRWADGSDNEYAGVEVPNTAVNATQYNLYLQTSAPYSGTPAQRTIWNQPFGPYQDVVQAPVNLHPQVFDFNGNEHDNVGLQNGNKLYSWNQTASGDPTPLLDYLPWTVQTASGGDALVEDGDVNETSAAQLRTGASAAGGCMDDWPGNHQAELHPCTGLITDPNPGFGDGPGEDLSAYLPETVRASNGAPTDAFRLRSVTPSGRGLCLAAGSFAQGSVLDDTPCRNSALQEWRMTPTATQGLVTFTLMNGSTLWFMDLANGSTTTGTKWVIGKGTGLPTQTVRLMPTEAGLLLQDVGSGVADACIDIWTPTSGDYHSATMQSCDRAAYEGSPMTVVPNADGTFELQSSMDPSFCATADDVDRRLHWTGCQNGNPAKFWWQPAESAAGRELMIGAEQFGIVNGRDVELGLGVPATFAERSLFVPGW